MGMAASQARFLGLTARKNNVEFEGQQINQQRTALSNKSASYYTDLLGMAVPVCPAVEDYTQTVYSFDDGSLHNQITSLIAQGNGAYTVAYLTNYTDDFSMVGMGRTSVVNTASGDYMVGADKLKLLGEDFAHAYVIHEGVATYRLTEAGFNYTYSAGGATRTLVPGETLIGQPPSRNDYTITDIVNDYSRTACYSDVASARTSPSSTFHIEHNLCELIWTYPEITSVTSSSGITISKTAAGANNYSLAGRSNPTIMTSGQDSINLHNALEEKFPATNQELIDLYIDTMLYCTKNNYYANTSLFTLTDANGNTMTRNDINLPADVNNVSLYNRWNTLQNTMKNLKDDNGYADALAEYNANADRLRGKYVDSQDQSKIYTIQEQKMFYDGQDEYLKTLSSDQLEKLAGEEVTYRDMLDDKNGTSDEGWYVRYKNNTTTGEWYPVFYCGDDIVNGIEDEHGIIRSNVATYQIGSSTIQNEIKGKSAYLEQDSTGRYINISFLDESGNTRTYALTTNTVTDNDAYNDAMNQYEFDKALYERKIQEINAKIEIIQAEDKNLELRLKQLDTEHNAIDNELSAVEKVIQKSTESGFKTFG